METSDYKQSQDAVYPDSLERETGLALDKLADSIPMRKDIEREIHYFHGVIGGHYTDHSQYEWFVLFILAAFSIATVLILIYQCFKLVRAVRKKHQHGQSVRAVIQSQLAEMTVRQANPGDYVDMETVATRQRASTPRV